MRLPAGHRLALHSHSPAEVYYVIQAPGQHRPLHTATDTENSSVSARLF